MTETNTNRMYKARIFEMVFSEKNTLLELYNAASGNNYTDPELLDASKTLRDYSEYTYRVRKYAKKMSIEDAVEKAITECIREGILEEFLSKNRAEAKKVSIYEYDQEKHMQQERESSWQDGHEAGILEGKNNKLIEQIQKKLQKGKTISEISDELEEPIERINFLIKEHNMIYFQKNV